MEAGNYQHQDKLLRLLESPDPREVDLAAGYFSQRLRHDGWTWLDGDLGGGKISPDLAGRLLLYTDAYP